MMHLPDPTPRHEPPQSRRRNASHGRAHLHVRGEEDAVVPHPVHELLGQYSAHDVFVHLIIAEVKFVLLCVLAVGRRRNRLLKLRRHIQPVHVRGTPQRARAHVPPRYDLVPTKSGKRQHRLVHGSILAVYCT